MEKGNKRRSIRQHICISIAVQSKNRHAKSEQTKETHGGGGSTSCHFCTDVEEDLIHFILMCPGYKEERKTVIELQQSYEENREEVIGFFLFIEENIEKKKKVLHQMWKRREEKKKIKEPAQLKRQRAPLQRLAPPTN